MTVAFHPAGVADRQEAVFQVGFTWRVDELGHVLAARAVGQGEVALELAVEAQVGWHPRDGEFVGLTGFHFAGAAHVEPRVLLLAESDTGILLLPGITIIGRGFLGLHSDPEVHRGFLVAADGGV